MYTFIECFLEYTHYLYFQFKSILSTFMKFYGYIYVYVCQHDIANCNVSRISLI